MMKGVPSSEPLAPPESAALARPTAAGYSAREVTKPPNWHTLVVWDLLLNAVATGSFLVAAVFDLLSRAPLEPLTRFVYPVLLVVLVCDLMCLVFDLGDPLKFHHMLRVIKPNSPMSFGTWSLTAFSGPLTLVVALDLAHALGWVDGQLFATGRKLVLAAGLAPAFCSLLYKGVLFSVSAQPGWRDARWLGAMHTTAGVQFGLLVLGTAAYLAGPGPGGVPRLDSMAFEFGLPFALIAAGFAAAILSLELRRTLTAPAFRRLVGVLAITYVSSIVLLALGAWGVAAALAAQLAGGYYYRRVLIFLPHEVAARTGSHILPPTTH